MKAETHSLKTNALWPGQAIFQSIAQLAPLATLVLTVQEIASYTGAMALSYTLALLITLLGVNTIVQMGSRFPHAGGYYSYVSNGISPSAGAYTAMLYLLYQVLNTAGIVMFTSWFAQDMLSLLNIQVHAYYLYPIPFLLILILPYFGIKPSVIFYLVTSGIEILLTIALIAVMGLHPAHVSNLAAPFISNTPATDFALSVIFSLFFFTGYGSMITIAEETRRPRRSVPLMAVLSVVLIGLLELAFIYFSEVAWGTSAMGGYASSSIFTVFLQARQYLGFLGFLLIGSFSIIASLEANIAVQNATSRVLFALGRDGVFPSWLGTVHPKYGSPHRAVLFNSALSLAIILVSYLSFHYLLHISEGTTIAAAVFLIALLTVAYLLVHIMANLSVTAFFARKERRSLSISKHVLMPVGATAAMLAALYESFSGLSGYMLALPVIVILFLLLSGIFVLRLRRRNRMALENTARVHV
ncbi:MAG: APC family permease [Thermoplasmata archaeon]|uniref:APC family permease n=1 Tax=Candidatus Sysuiplasma superficiale TaxID=2823368 RepID=A0A8J7YTQ6_9ARCH|nr:APC family permease [Candidatus Sysuiplasma superficiale]MBX8644900.1 APC family permease [Candidatus Sysuiplasma superficiale]